MTVFDDEAPVLKFWEIWSAPSLPLRLGTLCSWTVAFVKDSTTGQIELINHLTVCKQMPDIKLNWLCYIVIFETI